MYNTGAYARCSNCIHIYNNVVFAVVRISSLACRFTLDPIHMHSANSSWWESSQVSFYFDPMLRTYHENCCTLVFVAIFLCPNKYTIIYIYNIMKFIFAVWLKMRIDIFWLTWCLSIILHILHNHPIQFSRTSRKF